MSRVSWKKETVVLVLKTLLQDECHKNFLNKKKNNQMDTWYENVGEKYNVSGTKVRDLLRNLGKESRSFQQRACVSGEETYERTLKGSSEIFDLHEKYLNLYYSKGCAFQPKMILTESGEVDTSPIGGVEGREAATKNEAKSSKFPYSF